MTENIGHQFDLLPETAEDRVIEGRPSRIEILEWWEERFCIDRHHFDGYTFWEKGAGKIWIVHGSIISPLRVEALGMTFLRARQEHWKPTTNAVQRFGTYATKNRIRLNSAQSKQFVKGHDQPIEWDGEWGYLIACHDYAGQAVPIGVGLYLYGELRSTIPKGRRINPE